MKDTEPRVSLELPDASSGRGLRIALRSLGVYIELTKPRLSFLVVLTTAFGFYMAPGGESKVPLMLHTVFGTTLLAAGAAVLNQWMERETDKRMRRTKGRPVPSGRLTPERAMAFGVALSSFGLVYLGWAAGTLPTALGAATLVSYLFLYTPMKLKSAGSTLVGAIPGALPPLMGWTAASGRLDAGAAILFLIFFAWQLPHFLAIGWLYREDYARAGMPMLPVLDEDGTRTSRQALLYALTCVPLTLEVVRRGIAGWNYGFGVLTLGVAYFLAAAGFAVRRDAFWAKRLFLVSVFYPPVLMGLMMWDKVR